MRQNLLLPSAGVVQLPASTFLPNLLSEHREQWRVQSLENSLMSQCPGCTAFSKGGSYMLAMSKLCLSLPNSIYNFIRDKISLSKEPRWGERTGVFLSFLMWIKGSVVLLCFYVYH